MRRDDLFHDARVDSLNSDAMAGFDPADRLEPGPNVKSGLHAPLAAGDLVEPEAAQRQNRERKRRVQPAPAIARSRATSWVTSKGDNRISLSPFHGRHAGLDQGNHDKIGGKNGEARPHDAPGGGTADGLG